MKHNNAQEYYNAQILKGVTRQYCTVSSTEGFVIAS
jgi:hypothetical protein